MRILHAISSIDPAFGGTSEAVRVMIQHGPSGSSAEVVTVDDPAALFLRGIPFPVHALGPARSSYAYSPRLLPWLRANLHRFDGVILHGLWQYVGFATWRAARGRIPYLAFPHGMLDPYFKHAFPRKHMKKWPYWLAAEFWVLRGARRVLFTCEAEAELARQSFFLHRWRATVVPFGAVPSEGDPIAQREAFLSLCPRLRGRRLLLFLGRIHSKKGCDLLVQAFLRVASSDPDLDLVVAGPDQQSLAPELRRTVENASLSDRVHWPGMLTDDRKWGAFYASEAFILPSHQENFGIAVAEALSCGVPVLLSDKVNIAPEIAREGAGFMEPDTLEGTVRLLGRWIRTSLGDRALLSARALEIFHRRYDMRQGAKSIPRLFEPDPQPR